MKRARIFKYIDLDRRQPSFDNSQGHTHGELLRRRETATTADAAWAMNGRMCQLIMGRSLRCL